MSVKVTQMRIKNLTKNVIRIYYEWDVVFIKGATWLRNHAHPVIEIPVGDFSITTPYDFVRDYDVAIPVYKKVYTQEALNNLQRLLQLWEAQGENCYFIVPSETIRVIQELYGSHPILNNLYTVYRRVQDRSAEEGVVGCLGLVSNTTPAVLDQLKEQIDKNNQI